MAEGLKPLPLDVPEPKWDSFDPRRFVLDYDKDTDIMYVRHAQPRPGTNIDISEEVWLRIEPETGEILGFEIDDFELVFLKRHPELAALWKDVRPKATAERVAFVISVFLEFLKSLAGPHPQQPRLQPHAS